MEVTTRMAHRGLAGVLAAAATGDEVAFRHIIAAHHEDMRRVCLVICGDQAIADEATQAAWFIAWKKTGHTCGWIDPTWLGRRVEGGLELGPTTTLAQELLGLVRGDRHEPGPESVRTDHTPDFTHSWREQRTSCCAGGDCLVTLGASPRITEGMEAMTKAAAGDLSEVIASAAAGDEVAFGRIVAAHHGELIRICSIVSRDATIAEEATQAAWSIAWKKLESLRQSDRLRPWLIAVAVNEAKKLLKKRARRLDVEVSADLSSQPGGIDPATGIGYIDLQSAMERLEPDDRALLALRYVAGFDATELSDAVGISPAGVRQRLKRLLDQLRQDLSHG